MSGAPVSIASMYPFDTKDMFVQYMRDLYKEFISMVETQRGLFAQLKDVQNVLRSELVALSNDNNFVKASKKRLNELEKVHVVNHIHSFSSAEAFKQAVHAHELLKSIGGEKGLFALRERHHKSQTQEYANLGYDGMLDTIGLVKGGLAKMTWESRCTSLVRILDQNFAARDNFSDVSLQSVANVGGVEKFFNLSFEQVKASAVPVTAFSANKAFEEICGSTNLELLMAEILPKSSGKRKKSNGGAYDRTANCESLKDEIVKQIRFALQKAFPKVKLLPKKGSAGAGASSSTHTALEGEGEDGSEGSDDDVVIVGVRTRAERDAEGIASAITIE